MNDMPLDPRIIVGLLGDSEDVAAMAATVACANLVDAFMEIWSGTAIILKAAKISPDLPHVDPDAIREVRLELADVFEKLMLATAVDNDPDATDQCQTFRAHVITTAEEMRKQCLKEAPEL